MQLYNLFDEIKNKASSDKSFKKSLLSAYESQRPIINFCKECNSVGIEIYPMDIADADQSEYAAMRRSTNGGGENSPHLGWEGNIFDAFIEEIRGI